MLNGFSFSDRAQTEAEMAIPFGPHTIIGIRVGLVEMGTRRVPGARIALREWLIKKIAAAHATGLPAEPQETVEPASRKEVSQ